jgi:hypothetical protein
VNYTIFTGGGAKNMFGTFSTAGSTPITNEQLKVPVRIDTLQWFASSEGDWLYYGEDNGSTQGESAWIVKIVPNAPAANVPVYFMSQTSGGTSTSKNLQSIPPACNFLVTDSNPFRTRDLTNEYSGCWDLTGLLAKDSSGNFIATPSSKIRPINSTVSINNKSIMMGIQHHMSSGGVVGRNGQGEGGQVIMLKPKNLPTV